MDAEEFQRAKKDFKILQVLKYSTKVGNDIILGVQ